MKPEDVLRQAFEAQAGQVEFSPDALPRIRARIGTRRRQRSRALFSIASLATTAAATVIAVAVGFTSCLPGDRGSQPPGGSTTEPGLTTPATPTPSTLRAPVYFMGQSGGKPVLYWEYHQVPIGDGSVATRIRGALTVSLSGAVNDANYGSAWSTPVTVRSVTVTDDAVVVDLSGVTVGSTDPATDAIAVQQLIYTATGVATDMGSTRPGVRLLFDGAQRSTLWGSVPVAGILTRAPQGETLAQVWLVSPQEGNTVNPTFEVHINGSVPEANVILRVRDSGGTIVYDKPQTLSVGGPGRGDIKVPMTLAPGSYTLEAFYESPDDGSIQALDDHHITVR